VLGALYTKPLDALSTSSDIRTIETGIYLIPKTSWGGVPQYMPEVQDGVLVVFSFNANAKGYLFLTNGATVYSGIKWWSESITWKQLY